MDGLFRGLFNASAWFIPLLVLVVITLPLIVRVVGV